jgi:hypothetical protein
MDFKVEDNVVHTFLSQFSGGNPGMRPNGEDMHSRRSPAQMREQSTYLRLNQTSGEERFASSFPI